MKLSLAVTTYNRIDLTIKAIEKVLDDPRINDIVILDDCSPGNDVRYLQDWFNPYRKVRVIKQLFNRGMSMNKRDAISLCLNDWVIIFDSDNIIDKDYIDALEKVGSLQNNTIYCPEFAKPDFDYRKYAGQTYGYHNPVPINEPMANCLMNTCNYVVNRNAYLSCYEYHSTMKGTDTIWFNYLWLKARMYFYVVPGMQYFHRVHSGSGFMADVDYNMAQAEKVKQLILKLPHK